MSTIPIRPKPTVKSREGDSSTMIKVLSRPARLFPKLDTFMRKGDCGRLGVIGGSKEYTGAPYFSAMTQMKMGCDLSYVFCHPLSATVIKAYSPELIVYPSYELSQTMMRTLRICNSVVVGPGLGREYDVGLPLMRGLFKHAKATPNTCIIIDADALRYLPDCLDGDFSHRYENVVVTPNHWEFARLAERVLTEEAAQQLDVEEKAKQVATALGVCLMRKGCKDIITDGNKVLQSSAPGCPRRCGGLGDILGGASSAFIYWASLRAGDGYSKNSAHPIRNNYTREMLMEGCAAASDFVRYTSARTFNRLGRAMNAADVIADISEVVKKIDSDNAIDDD